MEQSRRPPHFKVDLDMPPRQRWKHIVPYYREFEAAMTAYRRASNAQYDHAQVRELLDASRLDAEFLEEMRGIVEELGQPEVTLETLMMGHLKYELGWSTGFECSGVLAAMENGTVVQGRNFDLSWKEAFGKPAVIEVTFWRGGRPLFSGVTAVGIVGISTALRFGGWSVQQNTRTQEHQTDRRSWIAGSVAAARAGALNQGLAIRRVLQDTPDFETAVATFAQMPMMAPGYIMLAGPRPYQGAVISFGRSVGPEAALHDVRRLSPQGDGWLLVQTNDDHWKPPKDDRRDAALRMMRGSRERLEERVWKTMRTDPVCNKETWFTWEAVPASSQTSVSTAEWCRT